MATDLSDIALAPVAEAAPSRPGERPFWRSMRFQSLLLLVVLSLFCLLPAAAGAGAVAG